MKDNTKENNNSNAIANQALQKKSKGILLEAPSKFQLKGSFQAPVQKTFNPNAEAESEKNEKAADASETLGDSLIGEKINWKSGGEDNVLGGGEKDFGGKTPMAGGVFAAFGSGVGLAIQIKNAAENWKASDKKEKLGLTAEVGEGLGKAVGNSAEAGAKFAENAGDKKAAEDAGMVKGSGLAFAGAIGALKSAVTTIYDVYKLYQLTKNDISASNTEKAKASLEILKGLLTTASKAVSSAKEITDMLNAGSAELAQAVPGLGACLNAVEIAIGAYNLMNARKNVAEMDFLLKGMEDERNVKEKAALLNLKELNQKKVKDLGINMAFDFVSLVGSIASCVPDPASQIAGLSLKIIGSGGKVLAFAVKSLLQARDNSAEKGGTFSKFFGGNKENGKDNKRQKNIDTIEYINKEISELGEGDEDQLFKVEALIRATGTEPNEFYRKYQSAGHDEALNLLYINM